MRKSFYLFIIVPLFFLSSCFKKDVCKSIDATIPSQEEIDALTDYVNAVNPNAVYDQRGFFYQIVKPGSNNHPGICSDILISYQGTTASGTSFTDNSTSTNVYYDLSDQIYGWRYAIPMIGMGGEMKLYLPPSLGTGNSSLIVTNIPASENLVYTIKLVRYN